jgi:putative PIN family toxin of toxin-antitoxin system
MRLVLDTNTVISALLWKGVPHDLFAAARDQRATTLHTSPKLLAELVDVLSRGKLASAVTATGEDADKLLSRYVNLAQVHVPTPIPPVVLSDPDVDEVLACAITANAHLIVSGDRDLLSLKTFREIRIVNAAEAIRIITTV